MTIRILAGDCRDLLPILPADSFDCIVTSPPYWGLRDYGIDGQIGLEPTLDAYVDQMVGVFSELRRVLKPSGTAWLNLGDSYAGGAAVGPAREGIVPGEGGKLQGRNRNGLGKVFGLKPKDLCGVPWRVAFALQADGWWLRSAIVWAKPNPMPESVTDRPTSAYEMVFLLTKADRYYFDSAAIAEDASSDFGRGIVDATQKTSGMDDHRTKRSHSGWMGGNGATRNARNVWTIATQRLKGSHFATMPPDLAERCIKAGCPIGGHVLDPFGGAGTTGLVADRLGRRATLIELNPTYRDMAARRVNDDAPLFAEVE